MFMFMFTYLLGIHLITCVPMPIATTTPDIEKQGQYTANNR